MLLYWPGEVRRKREDDFGQIGPALFAGTNNSDSPINNLFKSTKILDPSWVTGFLGLAREFT